jgi:hypothetical protein
MGDHPDGQHVIDENDAPPGDRGARLVGDAEGASDVAAALTRIEPLTPSYATYAPQRIDAGRQSGLFRADYRSLPGHLAHPPERPTPIPVIAYARVQSPGEDGSKGSAMPRYYFHVHNSFGVAADDEGENVESIDKARSIAIHAARTILTEELRKGLLDFRGQIVIADASGNVCAKVDYSDAVELRT